MKEKLADDRVMNNVPAKAPNHLLTECFRFFPLRVCTFFQQGTHSIVHVFCTLKLSWRFGHLGESQPGWGHLEKGWAEAVALYGRGWMLTTPQTMWQRLKVFLDITAWGRYWYHRIEAGILLNIPQFILQQRTLQTKLSAVLRLRMPGLRGPVCEAPKD